MDVTFLGRVNIVHALSRGYIHGGNTIVSLVPISTGVTIVHFNSPFNSPLKYSPN